MTVSYHTIKEVVVEEGSVERHRTGKFWTPSKELMKMAAAVIERVTKELMRKIRDSVHEKERRYLPHETNRRKQKISWRLERDPNSANSWEYRVVSRGWVISRNEKQRRLVLGRIGCYARILEKLAKGKASVREEWNPPGGDEATEKAVQGLIQLRNIEQLSLHPMVKESELTKIELGKEQHQRRIVNETICAKRKQQLYKLWKEFVISTRVREGLYEQLPTLGEGKCRCGKAKISCPHWPPTSTNEADAQFEYSIDERNTHRRPLIINWWRYFNEFANMEEWTVSESQQRYKEAEAIIREASPVVQQELEQTTKVRKRPKGWSCREYCKKVLMETGANVYVSV